MKRVKPRLFAILFSATLIAGGGTAANAEYADVNGMKMYYEVSGKGDPLVVLHGADMNIPTMGEIIPKLAGSHKVYALELQGHGRTTDIDRPITYPNLADDVAAFMDAVGLEKADVFGYSMGAIAGPAARDPPSGKGGPAHLRVGRLRL